VLKCCFLGRFHKVVNRITIKKVVYIVANHP